MRLLFRSIAALLVGALHVPAEVAEKGDQSSNRLADSNSPYLKQHANDPVDWYPWGEEAFEAARKQNKPIFLSVGFSTCHWCHVMARESFSNREIAAVMNKHFINIKLDREQRPDVDEVYMTFVQATTGQGGWPMSVWLTPDLKPFVGGTYFPPHDANGRPGFKTVLNQLATAWQKDEKNIRDHAGKLTDQLRDMVLGEADPAPGLPPLTQLREAVEKLSAVFDKMHGGFGEAPKFPKPSTLRFLQQQVRSKGSDSALGSEAMAMSLTTLRKMAAGGIHDHLGGGFHRYSVDAQWRIPHYEKMLYDQAQLAVAYLDAARITGDDALSQTARGILDYVQGRMTHPEGGFYSAEDADSLKSKDAAHKSEGAYYIWEKEEIDRLLTDQAGIFNYYYGVEPGGNAPAGSDPLGKLKGANTLHVRHSLKQTAERFDLSEKEVVNSLGASREKLLQARQNRIPPHRDEKVLAAWNGLMITAYARAYLQLGNPEYLESASRAAAFLRKHLYDEKRGVLMRSYLDEPAGIDAFCADYSLVIQGLLDLYEAGFDHRWLEWAVELQAKQDDLFYDSNLGSYFSSSGRDESVVLRSRKFHDDSEPSENAVAALNLQRMAAMLGKSEYSDKAALVLRAYGAQSELSPEACPLMLIALERQQRKPTQIVIAGRVGEQDTKALMDVARESAPAYRVLLLADGAEGQRFLASQAEFYATLTMKEGKATAYVCEDFVCRLPTTDPKQLAGLLRTDE